jgi:signal transduction histidine kinase/ligand-binding sensor domain-containing protein
MKPLSAQSLWSLVLALVVLPGGLIAQEAPANPPQVTRDFLIQNWQTDQGLPRNTILCLEQDYRGYLWMGTPQGLIRFDGLRFAAFENDASPVMARGSVQWLFADHAGDLWIATRRSGLFRCRDDVVMSVTSSNLSAPVAVDSVTQGNDGDVWITRGDGAVGEVTAGIFTPTALLGEIAKGPMLFNLTTDVDGNLWFAKQETYGRLVDGRPTNWIVHAGCVMKLAPSRQGGLWVSTGNELKRLKPGPDAREETVMALPLGPYGVNALYEDHNGTLWIGMLKEGLFRLKDGRLEKIEGISHTVWAILEDAEGNLWVGTEGAGLFKLRPRVFQLIDQQDGLPTSAINSISDEWVAPNGGGLGRLLATGKVEMAGGFERTGVSAVITDGAGGAWAGTAGGRLIHYVGGEPRSSLRLWQTGPQVRVLHRSPNGNLWVGGFPSGLFKFSAGEEFLKNDLSWRGFTNKSVTAIAETDDGTVWIGTSAGDLYACRGEDFQRYGADAGFSGATLSALLPEPDGSLWIGTLGSGLGKFQSGKVQFLGERAGLDDDVITQIQKDPAGWLWVGSSRGISRVLAAELQAVIEGRKSRASATRFGREDGLANVECTPGHQPSAWMSAAGELRFATSKGVVAFNPAAIPRNYLPPPLNLESVLVDGVAVSNFSNLKLTHDYKKIEFRYTAMSFMAPEKVRFKRHLSGFDEAWIEDDRARSATFPRLPPGQYTFFFTACNNDGVWNDEPLRVEFEVTPAVWQTAWFRMCAIGLFSLLIGGAARFVTKVRMRRKLARLEQANALERERTRISRDLHDDLGARLTQMALLTDLAADDSSASTDLKTQMKGVSAQARSALQSLDETVWMVNPQKDSLAHVIAYVAQYAEHFFQSTPILCRQEICSHPPECMMPGKLRRDIFMLVKESLNNVLKHSQASKVWLRVAVRGPLMRITVRDNGRGFDPASPTVRHGLENMRRRAESSGIKLAIRSRAGPGTCVALRLKLPLPPSAGRSWFTRSKS